MAVPSTRAQFKEMCLRRLGKPVIEINVDDDQVEDRIDEALRYYWDYHFDGSDRIYYKHILTDEDKVNKYITLPENINGAVRIFPVGGALMNTMNLFNIRYQIALNDLYTLTSISLVPYFMAMSHIAMIEELLVGQQPIRYNRHKDRCYIDMDWTLMPTDSYIIIEAYEVVDPEVWTDAWGDRWLAQYTTALIKRQWGNNLKKFDNMQMPGGLSFNGQKIYDEAIEEINQMEKEMISGYSLPVMDMIG
jgi:hypothetical protein